MFSKQLLVVKEAPHLYRMGDENNLKEAIDKASSYREDVMLQI